jgi:hypothetical protein
MPKSNDIRSKSNEGFGLERWRARQDPRLNGLWRWIPKERS